MAKRFKGRGRTGGGQDDAAKVKGRGFEVFRHPLSNLDPARLRAGLLHGARTHAEEFPGRLTALLALFRDVSPPHLVATLAAYGLQVGLSENGASSRELMQKIEQHHVELLQALMLTVPISEWGATPPQPLHVQVAIDTIQALAMGFQQRRLLAASEAEDIQQQTVIALSEKIRMHTQMVRNWGYYLDVGVISRELYGALDEPLKERHGFTAGELVGAGQALVTLLEARLNVRWTGLRKTMRGRTAQQIIRGFYKQFPDTPGSAEGVIDIMPAHCSREQAGAAMLALADTALMSTMTFTADELAAASGLDPQTADRVMNTLALDAGALCDQAPERFFMDNPVWAAPLMRIEPGAYFCPMPQAVFSKIHEIMRRLCDDAGALNALQSRRAAYLEAKVESLVRDALPGAVVRPNLTWRVGSARFETDLVARLDRTLIIVEAKSAALTPQGLRGAPDRVRRHIRELVVAPSEQSARLEALVWQASAGEAHALTSLSEFGDLVTDLDAVVRISVTLDDISILSSSVRELKEAGWVPADLELGTTINIADFGAVIDILDDPARLVHYFAERQRIQAAVELLADEMDYLGLYLRSGFNIAGLEGAGKRLVVTGMSKDIDHYYTCRDAGLNVRKPRILEQPYFAKLFATLGQQRPGRWLSVACDVMRGFDLAEQKQTEAWMNRLKRTVERSWRDPDHECSLLVTTPPMRDAVVLVHIYPPQLAQERRDRLAYLVSKAFDETGRRRCVVISRDTSRWNQAYSFAGVAIRPQG